MTIPSARDAFSLALLVLLVLATAAAFWLVWNNRGSEKIVTAVVPIAVGALLGIYLTVLVFGGEPPISSAFVTVSFTGLIIEYHSYYHVEIKYNPWKVYSRLNPFLKKTQPFRK